MMISNGSNHSYALRHSERELARLGVQARDAVEKLWLLALIAGNFRVARQN